MRVVIAFLTDVHQRLLITQRALDSHYGGYWELPGGKLDADETPYQALVREIREELDLAVITGECFASVEDEIHFSLFHINDYQGHLKLNARQMDYRWIHLSEISEFQFPKTNIKFFQFWQNYLEFHDGKFNSKS